MKKILQLVTLCLLVLGTYGCANTQAGAFKRKALFANLEFESAKAKVWDFDSTGKTNHYEEWEVKGLKSDTQKALETVGQAIELGKTMATKVP